MLIARVLIDSIDADGFLDADLEEITEALGEELEELELMILSVCFIKFNDWICRSRCPRIAGITCDSVGCTRFTRRRRFAASIPGPKPS